MDKSQLLTDLSPYIYGTTRLGDETIPFDRRVHIARAAMIGLYVGGILITGTFATRHAA